MTRGPSSPGSPVTAAEPLVLRCSTADALEAVTTAQRAKSTTRIVVVLPAPSARLARRLIDAGADGVVPAEDEADRLAATLNAVRSGQVCLPREARRAAQRPQLTNREKQVLSLLVLGLTNGEIARQLVVGETTVKTHVSSSLRKLGATSRAEAQRMIADPQEGLGTGILSIT